jgi:hypothetical protein
MASRRPGKISTNRAAEAPNKQAMRPAQCARLVASNATLHFNPAWLQYGW